MNRTVLALLIMVFATSGHTESVTTAYAGGSAKDVTLPSGAITKNVRMGPMHFTTGIPTAWVLQYETLADIDDAKAIQAEVLEVWEQIRAGVEKQEFKGAIIMVKGPEKSAILGSKRAQRNFVFKLSGDREWVISVPDIWKKELQPTASENGDKSPPLS